MEQIATKQEIFDRVVSHLRKQGKQSKDIVGRCSYRNGSGLMCAAGCLIPDDVYDPDFEGWGLYKHSSVVAWFDDRFGPNMTNFIYELQVIHDGYGPLKWEQKFKELASVHGLEYTPPGDKRC
jgi:hypothetical protein